MKTLFHERWKEIAGVILLALGIYLFLGIISFRLEDIPFHTSKPSSPVKNFAGVVGACTAFFICHTLGLSSFFLPVAVFAAGLIILRKKAIKFGALFIGSILIFVSFSSLLGLTWIDTSNSGYLPGGIIGAIFSQKLSPYFGRIGSYIILLTVFALGILLAYEVSFLKIMDFLKMPWRKIDFTRLVEAVERKKERNAASARADKIEAPEVHVPDEQGPVIITRHVPEKKEIRVKEAKKIREGQYQVPSLSLLSDVPLEGSESDEAIMAKAKELEETLSHFDIEAKVVEIHQGPVITSFEVEPAIGVKVSHITSLENDIALGLKARSIRIVAPIPGKSTIGIEVPNDKPRTVSLKEVLSSSAYTAHVSKLKVALGKDILGEVVVADLGEMPHLLIAGTTGSGKTVCINSLIASILFNATPDDVRFLMVDPKMVELASFDGLPHLLTPVVKEIKKLAPILKWIIHEMERRYELLAHVGARNIDTYNRMELKEEDLEMEDSPQVLNSDGKMPYLIIIIDELADIMVIAQNQVEEAITRLAQLSRAVGIHLVLATQRPSVDVITGVIKANFPCRISFQVSSKVDSRTVLDMNGAETLLGRGDMLYLPANLSKPIRLQGAMVKDEEIKTIVDFLCEDTEPQYYEDIFKAQSPTSYTSEDEPDGLYEDAVRIVKESSRASVSYLQRRLRIGYTRAARLIDRMEEEGIVGPFQGSKARAIMPEEESPEER